MPASVTLNDAGDILYVRLSDGDVKETREFGDHRLVDFDAGGEVIGAEFIGLDDGVDLRGLPDHCRLHDALLSAALPGLRFMADHAPDQQ